MTALPPAPTIEFDASDLPDPVLMPGVTQVREIVSQGRGEWLVPIALGIVAAYFIFYRGRGGRMDW